MVEAYDNGTIKPKVYLSDFVVRSENCQPITVITHECTFTANNEVWTAWTRKKDMFLRPKRRKERIMIWEFILPFGRLNLTSLTPKKIQKVMEKTGLTYTKAVDVFKYGEKQRWLLG